MQKYVHIVERNISTHSLTRRLTGGYVCRNLLTHYFNSQPHKEADGRFLYEGKGMVDISTHSLTRRLT